MRYEPEFCEWNPIENRPARTVGDPGACKNQATLLVSSRNRNGHIQLCDGCAALDSFAGNRRSLLKTFMRARI